MRLSTISALTPSFNRFSIDEGTVAWLRQIVGQIDPAPDAMYAELPGQQVVSA
jgi:hypothetical protein